MATGLRFLIVALVVAALLSAVASSEPFGQRLIRLETAQALPSIAGSLAHESVSTNALFLRYAAADADDPTLWMSARIAIERYGDLARETLDEYGLDPAFQQVLARYGADAILPVAYYRDHDLATLRARHWLGTQYRAASEHFQQWWASDADSEATMGGGGGGRDAASDDAETRPALTPERRGQIAIAILAREGHGFLDQFVLGDDGRVAWLQSERLVSDIGDFFTSGIRDLERQWRQGEPIGVADVGWAGVDLLVMTSAVKMLRAGRAVGAGAAVEGQGARLAAGETIAGGGRFINLSRTAKVAAVAGTAYVVVRHPSLVSALGANFASWLGWPVWLGQFLIWTLVLIPLLLVARFVYRWILAPLLWLLVPLLRATSRVPRWVGARDGVTAGTDGSARQRMAPDGKVMDSRSDRIATHDRV
ncbi:hypothetical protein [Salinicola rhizosphaerae]|uniref:Uncharacterized protein n=1 Tax=Salinicola rhizosphaerae TaxID=1443141 RepID=A0ABQ3E3G2_9GAMM|nr:hypothetical protein [Salinicola rhizosphaerae]GHB24599.1 hypothetical protein GCM10009038_24600 [Salinicola rhizosphaerae]